MEGKSFFTDRHFSYRVTNQEGAHSMVNGLQDYQLGQVITAIGGLGTAAFGLVDAAKSSIRGINRIGLKHIQEVVASLTPEGAGAGAPVNALRQADILQ